MPETPSFDSDLNEVAKCEKDYEWLNAVGYYEKAYAQLPEADFFKKGQILEKMGFAFCKSAMQAESVNEFRDRAGKAAEVYGKAIELKLN